MHRLLRVNITVVYSRSLPEALSVFPDLSHWKNTPYFIWCFAHYQLSELCGVFMFSDMLSMVRKYERMSGRQSWSEEDMAKAVAAVVSGKMGYKLAARTFHIPRSTLQRRASKIRYQLPDDSKPLMGHYRRVFTENQEKDLVGYIKSMEKYFMGVSRRDIRELAFQYAEDNNLNHPFDVNSRMAGEDWVRNFLKRNPELLNRSEKEYELEPVNFDQFYHFMCQLS